MGMPISHKITLDLVAGGRVSVELRPPGAAPSSYFVFMRDAGAQWIWPLIRKILHRAGQPVCDYVRVLRQNRLREQDVTGASLRALFRHEGYAFGIVLNPDSLPADLDEMGRKTFLFVRDPREVIAGLQTHSDAVPISESLRSPPVTGFSMQCRRLVDFCRERQHVRIVRLEDVTNGWMRLVSDIVATIGLNIPPESALRIAGSTTVIPNTALKSSYRERFDRNSRALLDRTFAEVLAFFGYLPEDSPSPVFLRHWGEFQVAMSERLSAVRTAYARAAAEPVNVAGQAARERATRMAPQAPAPTPHSRPPEPDPELFWRPKRNRKVKRTVLGRRITEETDDYGCRPVLGQLAAGERTLAAYGCSFTYGTALPVEDTFCSVLQSMLPRWRVENYGVPGYGTTQNLIQLRRNSRWSTPDYVTFCFYPPHRRRNVADISFRRMLMTFMPPAMPQRPYPRAALAGDGSLVIRYVKHPRWDLDGIDLSDFENDDYYLDLIAASIFEHAGEIVKQWGGHFFVTTLQGEFSPVLRRRLDDAGIPVVNASIEGREYTCMPDDPHPNALANRFYAERIRDYLIARAAVAGAVADPPAKPVQA